MRNVFNDKEIKSVLDNLTIVIDTREQNNSHIISAFNKNNIKYITKKIDYGDYTCMIPKGTIEGQIKDIWFDRNFVIERKNGIDEICGNLKDDAARLKKELAHMNKYNIEFYIFLENENYEKDLRTHNFRSQWEPKTLKKRISKGIEAEYKTMIIPVPKVCMASKIFDFFEGRVYNLLKHEGILL